MEKGLEKNSENEFIFDTSSFLSLESVYLLSKVLDFFTIITTYLVFGELEEFAQYDDILGVIAKRVLANRDKLSLEEARIIERLNYVGFVDEELFNLSLNEGIMLITDDLKLLRHTAGKIKRAFSTYFLTTFVIAEILTKKQALEKLEKMRNIRNWQNNIIYISTKEQLESLNYQ